MLNNYGFNDYKFFTEMSELAFEHHSYDLSLGIPDFDIDWRLKNYLKESADMINHSYESLSGNPKLIDAIIQFNKNRNNNLIIDADQVNIIPCSTFGLYTSLKSILNNGDEVIVIQPSYYTYAPSIVMNGGIPKYYDLEFGFEINWDKLNDCINDNTKAIIINSPQNPTGKFWTKEDWDQLYQLIKNREIYLISEEVYDIYYYDNLHHYSSFMHPELRKRTFCIFSFGKMFHSTGWKVSYLLADKTLLENFQAHQQYISYSSNSPCQYAITKYLSVFDSKDNRMLMEKKRNLFNELIELTPLVIEEKVQSGFFQIVNFRNINKKMTDVEFSKWLTVEKKVSCLPLSAFYQSKNNSDYIRFSFAKKDEMIIDAMNHLKINL